MWCPTTLLACLAHLWTRQNQQNSTVAAPSNRVLERVTRLFDYRHGTCCTSGNHCTLCIYRKLAPVAVHMQAPRGDSLGGTRNLGPPRRNSAELMTWTAVQADVFSRSPVFRRGFVCAHVCGPGSTFEYGRPRKYVCARMRARMH